MESMSMRSDVADQADAAKGAAHPFGTLWMDYVAPRHSTVTRYRHCPFPDRESLYAEFRPLVQRLLRLYGDDHELRQDLEGEIYCQFCHLLEAYDPLRGVPLRPYLVRQLSASVYTYARRHWRLQRREVSLEKGVGDTQTSDPSQQWDHELMIQQIRSKLPEAVARLPLRQRQVVIWRYYEHRSFEEIAEILNVRLATTRSILRHGLNNLRRWMTVSNLWAE